MEGFFFGKKPRDWLFSLFFFSWGVLQGICDHSIGNQHPINRSILPVYTHVPITEESSEFGSLHPNSPQF
jgi:hypothetical protein